MQDFEGSLPKYLRIRFWLQENIANENIKPGDKLPTEEELAGLFRVNRMTVRKAIDELVSDQMVTRKPGVGTFLLAKAPRQYTYTIGNLSGLLSELRSYGLESEIINVAKERIRPEQRIRSILNLKQGEPVLFILRVVLAQEEPIVLSRSYLQYNTYKALMNMDLKEGLYDLLTSRYKAQMHHSSDIFSVIMPDDKEIELFKHYDGPCIKLESVVFDPHDKPVGVFQALFRGDKYRFKFASAEYLFKK